jgi:hypothetical protein
VNREAESLEAVADPNQRHTLVDATSSILSFEHSLVKTPEETQCLVDTTRIEEKEAGKFPSPITRRRRDGCWCVLRGKSSQQLRSCIPPLKQRDKIRGETAEFV